MERPIDAAIAVAWIILFMADRDFDVLQLPMRCGEGKRFWLDIQGLLFVTIEDDIDRHAF